MEFLPFSTGTGNFSGSDSHLFSRARKKGFSFFFLWGDLVQNRPQNPAPASCLSSTRKSRSEVPEREDFGEENCLGKGGAEKAKKGKKDAQKKVGLSDPTALPPPPPRERCSNTVPIPLSHCVFCGIADYRCYNPTSLRYIMACRSPKTGRGGYRGKNLSLKPIALQGAYRQSRYSGTLRRIEKNHDTQRRGQDSTLSGLFLRPKSGNFLHILGRFPY